MTEKTKCPLCESSDHLVFERRNWGNWWDETDKDDGTYTCSIFSYTGNHKYGCGAIWDAKTKKVVAVQRAALTKANAADKISKMKQYNESIAND